MANEKENIKLYFQKRKDISIGELSINKEYQKELINFVYPKFLEEEIQLRLIEIIAIMNFKDDLLYNIVNQIYIKNVELNEKDLSSKEKNDFINKITSYVKKNTSAHDEDILNMITKMFEALTTTFSYKQSDDIDLVFPDEDFNYLSSESVSVKKESPEKKIKNLNPTKVAKYCIINGIPENIKELNDNINYNKSFPIALMTSMANIASIMEFKNEMSAKRRENYLKILKFIKEEDIKNGVYKFIYNFKKMALSDRIVVRFYHIWQDVLKNYNNMTEYQKNMIIDIFSKNTKENFENFRKSKENYKNEKIQSIEKIEKEDKEKQEIDILNIKITEPEKSRKIKNISLAFAENQNITDKVISIINGEYIEKWFFIKILIETITKNLQNEKSSEIDEIIDYNLRTLHKIILEFTIEDYEKSFYFFLKNYYQTSGRYVTYRVKTINNRVLMEMLKIKYGSDAPEIKVYISATNKMIINKKYIE